MLHTSLIIITFAVMNEEIREESTEAILIAPTPEVVDYLFDCGDITLCEYHKYQLDHNHHPTLNVDHEQ